MEDVHKEIHQAINLNHVGFLGWKMQQIKCLQYV
jgi:hypothetical protein